MKIVVKLPQEIDSNKVKRKIDDYIENFDRALEKHLYDYYVKNKKTYKTFFSKIEREESYDEFYNFDSNMENYFYRFKYIEQKHKEKEIYKKFKVVFDNLNTFSELILTEKELQIFNSLLEN